MTITQKFQEEFLRQIEEAANRYSLHHGQEIPKGFVVDKISLDYKQLAIKQYLAWFFKNDPVPFNHNGRTILVTKGPRGNDIDDAPQDLPQFADYLTVGTTPNQKADGLEYFENHEGETYQKYNMPNILFTVDNAGRIVIGPSIVHERFTTAKRVRAFNNNGLPYPGSPDEANLMMISSNFSVNRFESKENEAAILNHRFTFPNFLSGDMLLLKKTNGVERFADSTIIGRPFASETGDGAELWAKYYGDTYFVPYDDTIYIFPAGVSLLVRADDMVMYYHSELGVLSFSPPIGSYYIKPPGLDLLPNVFRESARYTHIMEEVQAQVDAMVRGGLTSAMMMTPALQKNLKAFSYIQNLIHIKDAENVPAGGKKTSKPTKRTKIIKHMAKSKKKYHR